jgi:integrase
MWHLMWRITLATGLRHGEVVGLSWEDFDLDTRRLFVRNQLQRQTDHSLVLKSTLKANTEPREIIFDEATTTIIKACRREQTQYRLQPGSWGTRTFFSPTAWASQSNPRRLQQGRSNSLKVQGLRKSVCMMHDIPLPLYFSKVA